MANLQTFKGVLVGRGSALDEALKDTAHPELAQKIFKETGERYAALYPKEAREYFANWGKSDQH